MNGFDWQSSDDRDRSAALRTQAVATAPQRLDAALDRIADVLVGLTLERDQPPPVHVGAERVAIADHHTIAQVEERLDSAIAMLRAVLNAPVVHEPAPEPEPAGTPGHDDAPHHDG